MNPIILLFTLLILAVLAVFSFRAKREECHNAKAPTEDAPPEDTAAENPQAWAQAEIDAQKAAEAPKGISEAEIIEKVRAGLTRDQAIEVIKTQREHDAQLAKDAKKK